VDGYVKAADIPGCGDICPRLSGVSGVWGVSGGGKTHWKEKKIREEK